MLVPWLFAMLISAVAAQSGHPEFDPPMEQVVLEEGRSELIDCKARGELPLQYTWYNQVDEEISSDENQNVFVRKSGNGLSLGFFVVKQSDAGLYSCSATNKHGSASKTYDIIVNATSDNNGTDETASIGEVKLIDIGESSVEFDVQTTGDPDYFYIAYSEILDHEEKLVRIKKGEKAVVTGLVPSGRYVFTFKIEKDGYTFAPHDITLLPGVPDVIFRNIKDGSVEVEWFRSIDDLSRSTLEEYELSYTKMYIVGGRSWQPRDCTITVKIPLHDCSAARYTIAGLSRDTYYEIRLRMRTATGFGKSYTNKVYVQ